MAEPIRVVVADDQPLVRSGFAALLGLEADIEIVGQAEDGAAAVAMARELRPDVVVMDIRMPGTDGLAATRAITSEPDLAGVRVLVLTTFDLDEYVFEALRNGASGFLVKHADPDELTRAIRVIAAGESLLSPSVTRRLISHFSAVTGEATDDAGEDAARHGAQPAADRAMIAALTEREREVVELVAAGLSNDQIAGRWCVSNTTVRTHVSRAMTKLYARDRAQLVVLAYQHGLARPPRR